MGGVGTGLAGVALGAAAGAAIGALAQGDFRKLGAAEGAILGSWAAALGGLIVAIAVPTQRTAGITAAVAGVFAPTAVALGAAGYRQLRP